MIKRNIKEREQYCDWCGKSIGVFARYSDDGPESCGERECNREIAQLVAREQSASLYEERDRYYSV